MQPVKIEPAKALDEALKMQRKLAAGMKTLRELDDVGLRRDRQGSDLSRGQARLYRFKGGDNRRRKCRS